MISSITRAFWLIFSTIIFCSALAYALSSITETQKFFEVSPGTVDTVYTVQTEIPKEIQYSGTEVISSIYKLNLDGIKVTVDDVTFQAPADLTNKINHINRSGTYSQTVTYNGSGKVASIQYDLN